MANYYTHFSFEIDLKNQTEVEEAFEVYDTLSHAEAEHPLELQAIAERGYAGFEAIIEDGALWIRDSDGSGDPESAALFVQWLIRKHNLKPIGFDFAETCSAPRLDGFSGGAILITKDDIHRHNAGDWLDEKLKELEKGGAA